LGLLLGTHRRFLFNDQKCPLPSQGSFTPFSSSPLPTHLRPGKPLPLYILDQAYFMRAMINDISFLSYIKIIDYSILIGVDEEQKVGSGGVQSP